MIWHPLALAIWCGDLLAWAIGLDAARRLMIALPQWAPAAGDHPQLMRERSLELATIQGQWVLMLQAGSFLLLIFGLSTVWTAIVPGAMCGTGVLQAMGGGGRQTLLFRAAALLVFFAWRTAAQINSRHPEGMLWPVMGRLFLLGLPLTVLGSITWGQAIAAVDPAKAVDCCAVVYAAAARPISSHADSGIGGHAWITICVIGTLMLAAAGMARRRRPLWGGGWLGIFFWGLTLGWAVFCLQALRFGFGPYTYQVLEHPCPWCFFLPEHSRVGFLLFGALAMICLEQTAAGVAAVIAEKNAVLANAAQDRLRASQLRVAAAALVFCIAAMIPVLKWRLQFGAWMF